MISVAVGRGRNWTSWLNRKNQDWGFSPPNFTPFYFFGVAKNSEVFWCSENRRESARIGKSRRSFVFLAMSRSTFLLLELALYTKIQKYTQISPIIVYQLPWKYMYQKSNNIFTDFFCLLLRYSAVNQGHCHDKILQTLITQSQKLTLCSRAFHSNNLGKFAKYICNLWYLIQIGMKQKWN